MTTTNSATLTVTTPALGTTTHTWHGIHAAKLAAYWAAYWRGLGYEVR